MGIGSKTSSDQFLLTFVKNVCVELSAPAQGSEGHCLPGRARAEVHNLLLSAPLNLD